MSMLYTAYTAVKSLAILPPNINLTSNPRDITVHSFVLSQTKKNVDNVPNAQKSSNQFVLFVRNIFIPTTLFFKAFLTLVSTRPLKS